MLTIDKFLKNIVLDDNIKEYLNEIWGEIELYLQRLSSYSKEAQEYFLMDYLIKENKNSSDMENVLYTPEVINIFHEDGFIEKLDYEKLKLLNKLIRLKDKIIPEDKYINVLNIPYKEYLEREKINLEGSYREHNVWIGSELDINKAVHVPPTSEEVPLYMDDFIKYYNDEYFNVKNELNDPIVKSALLHVILIKIHPWGNGNGRTARVLLNNYLRKKINEKYNMDLQYPPLNLSLSFNLAKGAYNEKQNDIKFEDGIDNTRAINAWIKYNLFAIQEQLFYLNTKFDKYDKLLNMMKVK